MNRGDASGLSSWNPFSESFWTEGNFISESPLNPIPYYEKEIASYENGCGYFASVAHGLEGTLAGAALFAGGEDLAGAKAAEEAAAEAASKTEVPSAGQLLNEIAESLPDRYVYIASSAAAIVGGTGFIIYEGGKLIYEAVK